MTRCPECGRVPEIIYWSWFPYCSAPCRTATSGDFGPVTIPEGDTPNA